MSDHMDPNVVATYWTVGSFGPFPIEIVSTPDGFVVRPLEHDERGRFETIEAAIDFLRFDFGCTDGGLWESLEEAEAHAAEMDSE